MPQFVTRYVDRFFADLSDFERGEVTALLRCDKLSLASSQSGQVVVLPGDPRIARRSA